jgi:hypothetical protein
LKFIDVMHLTKLCCLDGIVGIKRVRGPIVVVVVDAALDFHFVRYRLALILASPEDVGSSY